MKLNKSIANSLMATSLVSLAVACGGSHEDPKTPAEQTVDDAKEGASDAAEEAGDEVEDAADDVEDATD